MGRTFETSFNPTSGPGFGGRIVREDPLPSGSLRYPRKGARRLEPGLTVCTASEFVPRPSALPSDDPSMTATEAKRVIIGGRVRVGEVVGLTEGLFPSVGDEISKRFTVIARAMRGGAGVVAR
jgi:hypothetical protein